MDREAWRAAPESDGVCKESDTTEQLNWTEVALMVKNRPAMQKTWVQALGREYSLEKGMQSTPVFLPGELHGQTSQAS